MRIVQTKDTLSDIYVDALRIRNEVFMKEQKVPLEEEIDDKEPYCIHFVLYNNDDTPTATCRLYPLENHQIKLQRMAVLKPYRKQHFGKVLVVEAENFAKEHGFKEIVLDAQLTALPFYEKLGYQAFGEEFLDANISHKKMQKNI